MTTDDLFAAFGGRDEIQAITGARRNAINNWRSTGVPFRHWPALVRAAERRGMPDVTLEALAQTRATAASREAA